MSVGLPAVPPYESKSTRRITLIGYQRRADVTVSADVPLGVLLPEMLRMLREPTADHPMTRRLFTTTGREVPLDTTLAFAAVPDGTVLRVVREYERPAAPVVHDVADEVSEDHSTRRWHWGDASRAWAGGAVGLALTVCAVLLAGAMYGADAAPWVIVAAAVLASAGALAAVTEQTEIGATLIVTGGVLGTVGGWQAAADRGSEAGMLLAVTGAPAIALVLLGLTTPLRRGGHIGATVVAATALSWLAAGAATGVAEAAERARAGAVIAFISALAIAALPRLVLMLSSMTSLDDRHAGGDRARRSEVADGLDATHRGLALATVTTAASAAVAGWLVLEDWNGWTVTVALALAAVLLSRSRMYPLAVEVIACTAAGIVILVRLLVLWAAEPSSGALPLLALSGLAAASLALLAVRPPDHIRVRARRLVNAVEMLAVVALFPVVVGVFGVYGQLLDTF